jgi:hypothetical protein
MSPTSFQAAPPRVIDFNIYTNLTLRSQWAKWPVLSFAADFSRKLAVIFGNIRFTGRNFYGAAFS